MKGFVDHEHFRLKYIDGKKWRVTTGFTYWLNKLEYVDITRGFETDFASIPRVLKVQWPSPGGLWDLPAVVHDALYRRGCVRNIYGSHRTVQRDEADRVFKNGMEELGLRKTAVLCLYAGVRLGGWKAWAWHRGNRK